MSPDPLLGDAPDGGARENCAPPDDSKPFAGLPIRPDEYTDGRKLWDWRSKYAPDARKAINVEAVVLAGLLLASLVFSGIFLGLAGQSLQLQLGSLPAPQASGAAGPLTLIVEFRLLALFFTGSVGGTTFSIKWLLHATAKGRWHLDRRYWRLFVPFIAGVYACVVLTLFDAGLIGGGQVSGEPRPIAIAAAFAFLVGYFSDGVSGLLSNVANAVFGTLEKK